MTRIIAGSARGHPLHVPPRGTRPTSDRVREAMFSRLEHLDAIAGARVLDLYAGSGALGLEALSRGAESAVFVEAHAPSARVCRGNLRRLGWDDRGGIITASVRSYLTGPAPAQPFHTVLADPPYDLTEHADVISLLTRRWLAPEAVIMWEQPSAAAPVPWPEPLRGLEGRVYGETRLNFAELPPGALDEPEPPRERHPRAKPGTLEG